MTSGPRKRRHWQVAFGLSILVVALALFAWQQGGDGGSSGPLSAIAEAAAKTQQEPGGRAVMHSLVTAPGQSTPIKMRGWIVFDAEGGTRGVITAPRTASGGPLKLEIVSDGTVMYMRSDKFGSLPNGAKWMSLDLSLGDELDPTTLPEVDAKGELALLEGVGNEQKLGKEDVRGVSTTRYRGTLSVADQVEKMRSEGADNIASVTEKDGGPMQVEAWIDEEGLVRRMRLVHTVPNGQDGGLVTMDMTVDLLDFGIEPEIEVPDSSEVFDATEVTKEHLGVGS